MGVDERNNLGREGWDARRTARSHFECHRMNQEVSGSRKNQRALFTTEWRSARRLRIELSKTCFQHRLLYKFKTIS
jgi:hypothetical protein